MRFDILVIPGRMKRDVYPFQIMNLFKPDFGLAHVDNFRGGQHTMNRRQILKGGLALTCTGLAALTVLQPVHAADDPVPYTPEIYKAALESGEPFMLDFYASW